MAKTNPIGVRFDQELLDKVRAASLANSPQKALNLYERSYLELIELKVKINNQPENKQRIEEERAGLEPCKTFIELMNFAKDGNSRQDVEAEINKNTKLSPGQKDAIRSKIK